MSTQKTTRKSREAEDRVKHWTPPEKLATPEPPEGYKYRWVRRELSGDDEDGNVYRRIREGYVVVHSEEIEGFSVDEVREGRYTGVVRSGDLILMKAPDHIIEERTAHYAKQARLMQKSVDRELDKEGTDDMPIIRENKATVTRGRPGGRNAEFDGD